MDREPQPQSGPHHDDGHDPDEGSLAHLRRDMPRERQQRERNEGQDKLRADVPDPVVMTAVEMATSLKPNEENIA